MKGLLRKLVPRLRWTALSQVRLKADTTYGRSTVTDGRSRVTDGRSTVAAGEIAASGGGDPLAFFDPEPPPTEISLDQVVERMTPVSWAEAVAILNAVCTVVTTGSVEEQVPEQLSGITITASGTVLVDGGKSGSNGPRLARILLALTASTNLPVPLRLFITKWASFTDAHTVADFARELAHFVRPNGAELIQAVFERSIAAVPVRRPNEQEKKDHEPPPESIRSERKRPHHVWLTAGAAAVSAFAAVGVWLWSSDASRSALPVVEVPTAAQIQAAVGLTEQSGAPSETRAASLTAVSTASGANRPDSALQRQRPNVQPAARPLAAPPTDEVHIVPLPVGLTAPVPSGSSTPASASEITAPPMPVGSVNGTDSTHIYSGADADVTPPAIIDASLPPPLLSDGREVNTMELVISERGHVERVRLVSKPRRMADMMLLSGAKNWKFEPASKDGFSVKYRLLLSWAATP